MVTAFLSLMLSFANAGIVDMGVPQDALGHYEFDLYDANGLQRGTSTNPLFTGRTWSLLSSTDSIGAVEQGAWNITNITGTVSLPQGASTAALQTSENTTLSTISSQLPAHSVYSVKVVSGNTTLQIRTGAGVLHAIVVGANSTGGTIIVYDGTSTAGPVVMAANAGTPSGGLLSGSGNPGPVSLAPLEISYNNGLYAVSSGSTSNYFLVVYY